MRSRKAAAPGDQAQHKEHTQRGAPAGETIAAELKQAIRDAALEVLGPAARQATTSAAKYAVAKAPELVTKRVMPTVLKGGDGSDLAQQVRAKGVEMLSQMGGIGGVAGKLLSRLGGGRGAASGWGRGRRMPVQQHIYVSVPIKAAYNGWTEYKQWSRYMHRVNQVDSQVHDGEVRLKVTEKMWGFTRPFTAEILTQHPDEQIKWNSTEGPKHTGVINFHELGPRLTLIEVNVDHSPSGPVEKLARGARFVKRAVRADFHRFQAWVEMKNEDELDALEGWRGTIEDGHVVTSHEEAIEQEQERETQPQEEEYEAEPEAGEEEEPQAAEEEQAEEEPEPAEHEPRRRRPVAARRERGRPVGRGRR